MIQEAPTAPVVTPGVPAELSPAPVAGGKTTEKETAPNQEKPPRPSGRLMWHIAHGEFGNGQTDPSKTTNTVSEKSYQALDAQHDDVRNTDSVLRQRRIREKLKQAGIPEEEITSARMHQEEMKEWAEKEAQKITAMATQDKDTLVVLQKLNFSFPDNPPSPDFTKAVQDSLYTESGSYGTFYEAFCRRGLETNKLLAEKLTQEEIDAIKPFLTDILGGETAFQALKALKQTADTLPTLDSQQQTNIYTTESNFRDAGEKKVFDYFQEGAKLVKDHPTPLPAPETVGKPTLTAEEQKVKDEIAKKLQEQLRDLRNDLRDNGVSRSTLEKETAALGLDDDMVKMVLAQQPTFLTDIPADEFQRQLRQKNYRVLAAKEEAFPQDPARSENIRLSKRSELNGAFSRVVVRSLEEQIINTFEQGKLPYASLPDTVKAGIREFAQITGQDINGRVMRSKLQKQTVKIGNQEVRADIGYELLNQLMNDFNVTYDENSPETVSQPEQNPTPPETTAIPQWPSLDYEHLAASTPVSDFVRSDGAVRDLQAVIPTITPPNISREIDITILYDHLTQRDPQVQTGLEPFANDDARKEYKIAIDAENQRRDADKKIAVSPGNRSDSKATEFYTDGGSDFPFHYVKPMNQWQDSSNPMRLYVTLNPANARYIHENFIEVVYALSDAGVDFEAKAASPKTVGAREDNMVFYFSEAQRDKVEEVMKTYFENHPNLAQGHTQTGVPDSIDGLSWAREPDATQTKLVKEITGNTNSTVSYNEVVSAMTLPFYLQRIEKMYRDAGKTADANIIHQEFERVHAVMQKYTPEQEAEQKLTNAETSGEKPKTVEDIRREVFENAGRRSAEEVSQLIGDVQHILTQEKEAGRGKMKATIQEMNDSPDTNQTKPTREGEVVFLPKGAGKLVALGDIHGDLATIQQVLTKEHVLEDLAAGSPVQVVFMGDLVDRGPKDIEVMEAVMMLKKLYPDHITIMKADHEMTRDEINHHPITDHGFPTHLGNRFHQDGVRLNNELADLFDLSPRMVEGANGLRLVHGGPGMQPLNLQEYAHLSQEEVQRIFDREITWADPVSNGDRATNLKSQKEKMLGDLRKRIDTNDFSPYFEPPSNPTHGTSGAPVLTTPEEIKELYQLLSELPEGFYPNIERTSSKSILRALRHGRLAYTEEGLQAPLKTVGDRVILRAHQTSRQVSGGEDAIKFGGKLGSIHTTGKGSPESAYSGGEPHPRYAVFDLGKPITQISPDNIKDVWSAESTVRVSPESTEGQTPSPTPEKIKELGGNAYWYMRKKSREAPPAQEFSQAMFGVQGNEALMSAFGEISKDPNDIGRHFYGHGIAKESTTDQLQALINILQGDKAKGTSTTVTLSSNNTNYPVYSGGGFVIIGSKDKQLLKDDGTFAVNLVAVNEQFYDAIPTLHEWFPNVQFVKAEDLPEVLKKQVGESPSPETSSPTPEKIRELAHQAFEYMHNSQNNPPETGSVFEQMGDPGNRALGNAINKISADDGAHFESHGIARGTTREQLQALVNLLEGQGFSTIKSTTVPLSSDNSYQRPYTHGGFIIIGPKDTQMVGQDGTLNIKMVAVNEQFYHAIPTLQEWFPNVQFIKADDLPEVVEKLVHPSP